MKDYLGNDINENDLVVYSSFEGSGLSKGIVTALTPKMVRIFPIKGKTWSWREDRTILRDPLYVLVVAHNQVIPS